VHGLELWKSDGTAAGTVLVKDINNGKRIGIAQLLTDVNGTLYFLPMTVCMAGNSGNRTHGRRHRPGQGY